MSSNLSMEPGSGRLGGGSDPGASGEEDWREKYPEIANSEPPERKGGSLSSPLGPSAINLEETVAVVKEKMWYIGDAALKSVAEVLYGFGISPSVLGYSEEDLMEEDELYGAGDSFPQAVQKDEVVSKTSFAMRSEERLQRRKADDLGTQQVDEAEDGAVVFLPPEESGWGTEEAPAVEFGEDKKDK